MKKILSCIILIGFVLSMCACGENATLDHPNASAVSESKTESGNESDASTLESFLKSYHADAKYKSCKGHVRSRDASFEDFSLEIYESDTYTYCSFISKADGIDYVMRYSPASQDESIETLYNSQWVKYVDGRSYLRSIPENYAILLNAIFSGFDIEDGAVEINGEKFESKSGVCRYTIGHDTDAVLVNFLFRNGKWDSFALSDLNQDQTTTVMAIYEDFVFSDTPSEDSRLYTCLNASTDDQIVAYEMISDSMYPALKAGGLYFFRKTDISSLKIGDIVLAYRDSESYYIAHRIVEIKDDGAGFILCGDQGISNDEVYPPQNIIGVLAES